MSVSDVIFGVNGSSPLSGYIKFASSGVTINVLKDDSTTVNLIDIANADYPIESDVRFGTSFGATLYTGTLAVPPVGAVSLGVPVDNTVGTQPTSAVVAADLLNEISTSSNALAERLRNVSTIQTTGAQISALTLT
jgi:hypothetical protein